MGFSHTKMKTILFLPIFAITLIISCGVTEQKPLDKPKIEKSIYGHK